MANTPHKGGFCCGRLVRKAIRMSLRTLSLMVQTLIGALIFIQGALVPLAYAQTLEVSSAPWVISDTSTTTVKLAVEREFGVNSPMVEVARCESQFRQFDNNDKVLKNPHSPAYGVFQIMASVHETDAKSIGLDIYTLQGNIAFAKVLYDSQGLTPWEASRPCWSRYFAYQPPKVVSE